MVKSKMAARLFLLILAFFVVIGVFSAVNVPTITTVYADIEDNIGSGDTDNGDFGNLQDQELDKNDQGVADWLKNQEGLTPEHLKKASGTLNPVVNLIGYLAGGIIILTVAGVTVITALDLMYIAIPPVRNILYKAGTDGTGGYTGGYGAGGYGRGMHGMMGGMGAMGAGGAAGGTGKPTQWVSDEAVACAAMLGGSAQGQGMMGGMGAMGYGMGAMGGMQQPQQNVTTKSVIAMYFRKRLFFIVLFAICIIVLTSCAVMDCGVNLAEWILKIINMLNGKM